MLFVVEHRDVRQGGAGKSYQLANDGTHVENTPEPGKVVALLVLMGVGNHDGTLGSPEQTGADTEQGTGEDVEASNISVDRGEQTGGVEGVSNTTKGEGVLDTKLVDKGTTKETENRKGTVQGRVLRIVEPAVSNGQPRVWPLTAAKRVGNQ
jgi:hypothetical protein